MPKKAPKKGFFGALKDAVESMITSAAPPQLNPKVREARIEKAVNESRAPSNPSSTMGTPPTRVVTDSDERERKKRVAEKLARQHRGDNQVK